MDIAAFRSFITFLVMGISLAIFRRDALKIRWKDLWIFLGSGILSVVFFNVCYFSCMNYTSLSTAAILLYTAPSFVMVMSFFLFKEKLDKKKLLALLCAFIGCVFVSGGIGGGGISAMGLLTGLGAGLGYALYSIFSRFALQKGYSSYTITTYTFLLAAIGTLPFLNLKELTGNICGMGPWALISALLAIMTTVIPYICYTKGLEGLENTKASILASIEPVVASLVGLLVYQEKMGLMGVLGMALVLLSCFLVSG